MLLWPQLRLKHEASWDRLSSLCYLFLYFLPSPFREHNCLHLLFLYPDLSTTFVSPFIKSVVSLFPLSVQIFFSLRSLMLTVSMCQASTYQSLEIKVWSSSPSETPVQSFLVLWNSETWNYTACESDANTNGNWKATQKMYSSKIGNSYLKVSFCYRWISSDH